MRQTRTLTEQHAVEDAVMASEIEQLPDFHGYWAIEGGIRARMEEGDCFQVLIKVPNNVNQRPEWLQRPPVMSAHLCCAI